MNRENETHDWLIGVDTPYESEFESGVEYVEVQ